jgi:hypothetical protein
MARYCRSVVVHASPDEVFAYMAAFENAAEWDPGVLAAARLGVGEPGIGARTRVLASFLGTRTELVYEIVKFDPPHSVTLVAEHDRFRSEDTIRCEPAQGGAATLLTYEAKLTAKGALALSDPALQLALRCMGNRAFFGLERTLEERWARRGARRPLG